MPISGVSLNILFILTCNISYIVLFVKLKYLNIKYSIKVNNTGFTYKIYFVKSYLTCEMFYISLFVKYNFY